MLDRFTWLDRGARRPRGAHAPQSRGEPLPLLQPARAARARRVGPRPRRRVPARAAQRDARVGRGARLPRARAPRRRDRVAHRPRRGLRPRRVHAPRRHRLHPSSVDSPPRRSPFMPEATHIASGKVREIYALDDDRLLLVASDRISTFDVDSPDGDPRQGARAHRPLGLLVHAAARDRPEPHARDPRRRALDGVPAARDAADRVRRARLSRRLGLEGLPGDGLDVGPRAARGPARVGQAAGADLHAGDEGADRATTRTSRRDQAAELVGAERLRRGRAGLHRALQRSPRSTRRRAGSSSPTRSSSSATTPTARSCSATRR